MDIILPLGISPLIGPPSISSRIFLSNPLFSWIGVMPHLLQWWQSLLLRGIWDTRKQIYLTRKLVSSECVRNVSCFLHIFLMMQLQWLKYQNFLINIIIYPSSRFVRLISSYTQTLTFTYARMINKWINLNNNKNRLLGSFEWKKLID